MPENCPYCGNPPSEFHAADCPAIRTTRPQIAFRKLEEALRPEALKFDQEKLPLHLIDPLWLKTTAEVLAFGEKKYGAWNWAKGTFEWHRLYRAAMGHLTDWYAGEETDPETGLSHLWHASCCLMFLTRYVHDNLGKDTRPRFPQQETYYEAPPQAPPSPPQGAAPDAD